jgi:hypothetical protein
MKYTLVQRFYKVEAVGTPDARSGELCDPIGVQIAVTPSDNSQSVIETHTGPDDTLYELSRGVIGYDLDEALYQDGKSYTAHYRFTVIPGVVRVVRQTFLWNSVKSSPRDPANVLVTGRFTTMQGIPRSFEDFTVELYKDTITLTSRVSIAPVTTDAFGNWCVELPANSIVRFVLDSGPVLKKTGEAGTCSDFDDISTYSGTDDRRIDAYGYPLP